MPKRTHEEAMLTKQQIMDAAYKVFSEKGYDKTSLSDIAREAGVTRGAIYWHFEDKAELLCELIRGMAEKHNLAGHLRRAADPEETDPLGLLKQWMLQYSTLEAQKLFTSNLGLVVRAVFDGTETENALRERVHEMLLERDQILSAAVVNAVNHRQLPSNADVELICSFLTYILNGYCNVDRFGFRAQDQENVYQRLVDFCFDELSQLKRRSSVRRRGSALGLAHLQLS